MFLSFHSFAQCYSKIVSYSRNYIALQTDGTIWAKGTGYGGFLGFGNNNAVQNFTQIGSDSNWTNKMAINGVNVFVIKTDGTLWVWGNNFPDGSAGLGTYNNLGYFGPTQVGTDSDWAEVASGSAFTLAVKTNGTLWSWGENNGGKLGIGSLQDSYKNNIPIQVGMEANWSKVFAGRGNTAYAIKTNGTLWSWGNNGDYIGYTEAITNNNFRTPHQVGNDTWSFITIGGIYSMTDGIKTDGSLWGWGSSNFQTYLFGNGIDVYASTTPVVVFPNPFTDNFTRNLNTSSDENVQIKVYDMIGRVIESREATASEMTAQSIGDKYRSGVYTIVIKQRAQSESLRVIKR